MHWPNAVPACWIAVTSGEGGGGGAGWAGVCPAAGGVVGCPGWACARAATGSAAKESATRIGSGS
jgi:hypothetical protein